MTTERGIDLEEFYSAVMSDPSILEDMINASRKHIAKEEGIELKDPKTELERITDFINDHCVIDTDGEIERETFISSYEYHAHQLLDEPRKLLPNIKKAGFTEVGSLQRSGVTYYTGIRSLNKEELVELEPIIEPEVETTTEEIEVSKEVDTEQVAAVLVEQEPEAIPFEEELIAGLRQWWAKVQMQEKVAKQSDANKVALAAAEAVMAAMAGEKL